MCHVQGSAEEQPLADAAFSVKITRKKIDVAIRTIQS